MSQHTPTVHVVYDGIQEYKEIQLLLGTLSYPFIGYASVTEYLASNDTFSPGCLLLNANQTSLDQLAKFTEYHSLLTYIVIIEHGDIDMAVNLMKKGATAVIEKTKNQKALIDSIYRSIEVDVKNREKACYLSDIHQRFKKLTQREKEILDLIVNGRSNKSIAYELGIACKTVENHRIRIMSKMQASHLPQLIRMIFALEQNTNSRIVYGPPKINKML